jgi:outer membrane protein OmpA-like peptidoglycan-associated protein
MADHPFSPTRRRFLELGSIAFGSLTLAGTGLSAPAIAADGMQTAEEIQRMLGVKVEVERPLRKPLRVLRLDPRLRRIAPSIDIYAIQFRSGSPEIDRTELWKIEEIATAFDRMLASNINEVFLLEGHTDSTGSRRANLQLSHLRAYNVATLLNRSFGIPRHAIEPVGFGEEEPLARERDWRNRRVTIRRVTDFIRK